MSLLAIFAVALGMLVSAQSGMNAELRRALGNPVLAAIVSFAIGTLALSVLGLLMRVQWPSAAEASRAPWWAWIGGLLGATYIAVVVVLAPRLGAAVLTAAVVSGQLAAALALDHFGLLGFAQKSVTPLRGIGALLLFAGVYLIQKQ